jgi:hypothetical protein
MQTTTLKPDKPAEAVNPITDQKIGPWGIHRTSTGIVIDRDISDGSRRAAGGVYFELDDPGYGVLHVLISPQPRTQEERETVVEAVEEQPPIADAAEPVVEAATEAVT